MAVFTPWVSRSNLLWVLPVNLKSSNWARQSWLCPKALRARSSGQVSLVLTVQPDHRDGEVGRPHLRPAIERCLIHHLVDLPGALLDCRDDPRISGRFLVLGECLEQGEERPGVVGLVAGGIADGSQPAVGLLVFEDVVDDPLDLRLERRVVQQVGEGNQTVEPVGHSLPALGLAAGPGAVLDVRPELVEMPAQPGGLDPELVAKPAGGLDPSQGKRPEGRWLRARTCGFRVARQHRI